VSCNTKRRKRGEMKVVDVFGNCRRGRVIRLLAASKKKTVCGEQEDSKVLLSTFCCDCVLVFYIV
jgi:hypothetical protein